MHTITAWKVVETHPVGDAAREVHVVPEIEITYPLEAGQGAPEEHTLSAECFCSPDVEVYRNPLFIHRGFEN